MNSTFVCSVKKTPFEIVFGQKPNGVHQLGTAVKCVNEKDILDIVEDQTIETTPEQEQIFDTTPFTTHYPHKSISGNTEGPFDVTCEKRAKLRQDVAKRLAENAEMMCRKYAKGKRIKVFRTSKGIMFR